MRSCFLPMLELPHCLLRSHTASPWGHIIQILPRCPLSQQLSVSMQELRGGGGGGMHVAHTARTVAPKQRRPTSLWLLVPSVCCLATGRSRHFVLQLRDFGSSSEFVALNVGPCMRAHSAGVASVSR